MSVPRKRILFFAEAVTLAHVMRPIQLARALDPARYDVRLACAPRYLNLFPDLQLEQVNLDSVSSAAFMQALARGQRVYSRQQLSAYVEQDLEIIDAFGPDLIVGDFRLSMAVSAPLARVPSCCITNAYWSPYSQAPTPIPEHPLVGLLGVAAAQRLFSLVRPLVFAWHARPLNQVRKHYGLAGLGHDLRRSYTWADHTLYADIPQLSAIADAPASHHFLGPLLWSPAIPLPPWWAELPDTRPVVYLNLGSSGRHDLLGLILASLGRLPVTVVAASLGQQIDIPLPDNVYIADYLPGDAAAARASLVICNGGSPATQQALAAGRPVLGIAANMDQHMNMAEITRFGAGLSLRSDQISETALHQAVSSLLAQPRFDARASEVQALYRKHPAAQRFAALVAELT